jgi:hypothetical protein
LKREKKNKERKSQSKEVSTETERGEMRVKEKRIPVFN